MFLQPRLSKLMWHNHFELDIMSPYVVIEIRLIILWQLNLINHHLCGDWKFLVANLVAIENIPCPIVWRPNFFWSPYASGLKAFTLDFGHLIHMDWSPPLIWQQNLVMLGNKKTNLAVSIHFFLWGVWALCCLIRNHCHIP